VKQPIPAALDTGRLKRVGCRRPSCLQLRPTGWRAQRCPGLRTQVRENLFDHRLLEDRRDDLQPATTIRALFQVDLEQALEQLGRAQQNRTVVRTGHHALSRRRGLRGLRGLRGPLSFLQHYLRAYLGVGCENAMASESSAV